MERSFEGMTPEETDEKFKDMDIIEHFAEPLDVLPHPRSVDPPSTPRDHPTLFNPDEIEWGTPNAEFGDGEIA